MGFRSVSSTAMKSMFRARRMLPFRSSSKRVTSFVSMKAYMRSHAPQSEIEF